MTEKYLNNTNIVNFEHKDIQSLIDQRRWKNLDNFNKIGAAYQFVKDDFCGYGVATKCFSSPDTDWRGENTYIQKEGIHDDFGLYDSPDEFYFEKGTNLSGFKRWIYQRLIRHLINMNVSKLRNRKVLEVQNAQP
ncbi:MULTISPECIES: hypothetical protein [unclassified Acinetobacter]|uniref:hypothetical protein n=1 Tax=unclassified Acinetobacter TaxID=196816 RepID=UPI0015D2A192|nr:MULTISPECIES: hypothetical protein [unclassified Acinetobacter]QOW51522.1 hypothetical protein G0029_17230 [Acinetobacter sp. YH12138]